MILLLIKMAIPLVIYYKIFFYYYKYFYNFINMFFFKTIGNISQVLIGVSSVLFVGHLGGEEFDAVSLANSVFKLKLKRLTFY